MGTGCSSALQCTSSLTSVLHLGNSLVVDPVFLLKKYYPGLEDAEPSPSLGEGGGEASGSTILYWGPEKKN